MRQMEDERSHAFRMEAQARQEDYEVARQMDEKSRLSFKILVAAFACLLSVPLIFIRHLDFMLSVQAVEAELQAREVATIATDLQRSEEARHALQLEEEARHAFELEAEALYALQILSASVCLSVVCSLVHRCWHRSATASVSAALPDSTPSSTAAASQSDSTMCKVCVERPIHVKLRIIPVLKSPTTLTHPGELKFKTLNPASTPCSVSPKPTSYIYPLH